MLLWFLGLQITAANVFLFLYAGLGVAWKVPSEVISIWLGATVVEIVGIVLVIAKNLFPSGGASNLH